MIYLVLSAVTLALLYGVYRLVLSSTTLHRFNRTILLSILALSFILPAVRIDSLSMSLPELPEKKSVAPDNTTSFLPIIVNDEVMEPMGMADMNESATPIEIGAVSSTVQTIATAARIMNISLLNVITYIYAVGVVLMLLRLFIGIIRVETLCRLGGRRLSDGSKLVILDGEFQPSSWRNTILISRTDYESDSAAIIEHEQAHIRYHHSVDVLLSQIVCALQWFNPAAWMLKRSLTEVHEYEADATVLSCGFNERQYQVSLVQAALHRQVGLVTSNFADCSTKKRIKMMKRNQSSPFACLRALLMVPVVLVTILLASACKPKSNQDSYISAQNESAIESAADSVAQTSVQPAVISEPFDTAAFLQKYKQPYTTDMRNNSVIVENEGALWIKINGEYYESSLTGLLEDLKRLSKDATKVPEPDKVFVLYQSQKILGLCRDIVKELEKGYAQDNIHVFMNPMNRMRFGAKWGYNLNTEKDKCVLIRIKSNNLIQFTAWNSVNGHKTEASVKTVDELKAQLGKLFPNGKVKVGLESDGSCSERVTDLVTRLAYTAPFEMAPLNQGPAGMSRQDSIDYIILGKYDGDGGRKRHVKNMKWYNDNKDKEEFFRMGFKDGKLCVCKGNDPSKLQPIGFDQLVPYFKANCPDGNERSAIVLFEIADIDGVPVDFIDQVLTKMEGWITTFTKRLYLSPKHIE